MADKNDLIPVWIFRDVICLAEISDMVYAESGLRSEIYENPEFFKFLVDNAVVQELGLNTSSRSERDLLFDEQIADVVRGHLVGLDSSREGLMDRNGELAEDVQNIAREATAELADAYRRVRLETVWNTGENSNVRFSRSVPASREVMLACEYTGTHVLRATPAEIMRYASLSEVVSISFYDETLVFEEQRLDWALFGTHASNHQNQTGAATVRNAGWNGQGINIGVLEITRYNAANPHFTGATVEYVPVPTSPNPTNLPPPAANDDNHATLVTAIIVGQPVNGIEGVVPRARIFQAAITPHLNAGLTWNHMINGLNALAVPVHALHIVNISLSGVGGMGVYSELDRQIDLWVRNTNITIVTSAGNEGEAGGGVGSPAKGYNVITVGSAETVRNTSTPPNYTPTRLSQSYAMSSFSSFQHESFLPNKPDLIAPGSNIAIRNHNNSGFRHASGTSFAAPIVTGIAAQLMHHSPQYRNVPAAIKARLMLDARNSFMSTTNNGLIDGATGNHAPGANSYLRQRSGAGMAFAPNITNTWYRGGLTMGFVGSTPWQPIALPETLSSGQRIRVVLAFHRHCLNQPLVTATSPKDNLDIRLVHVATGTVVAWSTSTRNNVEIMEFGNPNSMSNTYQIQVRAVNVVDTTHGVRFSLQWNVM
jgi:hypothetical protein